MNNELRTGVLKWREPISDGWYIHPHGYIISAKDGSKLGDGWIIDRSVQTETAEPLPVPDELQIDFRVLSVWITAEHRIRQPRRP